MLSNLDDYASLATIKDWIRWTYTQFRKANLFYGHGFDNAWDESLFLILQALELPWDIDKEIYDSKITKSESQLLIKLIKKRIIDRMPLPYIVNKTMFCNLPFYVDQNVLIPRSPIAELIKKRFAPWVNTKNINNILDLGCGSGCIGIACAEYFPSANIYLTDISQKALDVAAINVDNFQLWNRVELIKSNFFENINSIIKPSEKFQLIISNPPYVSSEEMKNLPEEYHYEPKLALNSDNDGFNAIRQIITESINYLDKNGILVIEVGNRQKMFSNFYAKLECSWPKLKNGGHGIMITTASACKDYFNQTLNAI